MKNKIENKKIISIILITLLVLFTTKAYAVNDSFGTTIQTSGTQLKKEDIITITIGLKDIAIESGEKGIGAYTASIKFDSSVLEYVSTNGTDKWEAPFYQNGLITGNTKDGQVVNTAQSIGTITFKVKRDAKIGETNIELTNFLGSTVANDVMATSNSLVSVMIVDNNNNTNNGNTNNGNNINNGNNGNSNNNNNANLVQIPNSNNTINNTNASGKLPQTGERDIVLLVCIGSGIIFAVVWYIKMKKVK